MGESILTETTGSWLLRVLKTDEGWLLEISRNGFVGGEILYHSEVEAVATLREQLAYFQNDKRAQRLKAKKHKPTCSIEDCTKPTQAKGLCITHYQRQRRALLKDLQTQGTEATSLS